MSATKKVKKELCSSADESVQPNFSGELIALDFTNAVRTYRSEVGHDANFFSSIRLSLLIELQKFLILFDLIAAKYSSALIDLKVLEEDISFVENEISLWSTNGIKEGDNVDVFVPKESAWFEAKVLEVLRGNDGDSKIHSLAIHYLGWQKKFDCIISLDSSDFLVAPPNSFTKKRTVTVKKQKSTEDLAESVEEPNIVAVSEGNNSIDFNEVAIKNESTNGSGRKRKSIQNGFSNGNGENQTGSKSKAKQKDVDKNEWVCSICEFMEALDDSDLVLCDGPCLRSFHIGCLQAKQLSSEQSADDLWLCVDCREGKHFCFICGQRGDDFKEVLKCSFGSCGKHYHVKCLEDGDELQYSLAKNSIREVEVVVKVVEKTRESEAPGDGDGLIRRVTPTHVQWLQKQKLTLPSFRCPYHFCDTCFPTYRNNDCSSLKELSPCIRCPRAFHINCIPPGSRYNALCMICPRHPFDIMPSQDLRARSSLSSVGSRNPSAPPSIVKKEGNGKDPKKSVNSSSSKEKSVKSISMMLVNFWDQLVLPEAEPDAENPFDIHFKLQLHIKESLESIPPDWKLITRNDYDTLGKERVLTPQLHDICCDCTTVCGERCMNRILRYECSSGKNKSAQTCQVGPHCTNRVLQDKTYAEVEVFREPNMGWGLKSKQFVAAGHLVIEYLGEIIDFDEVQRRMKAQSKERPNDKDYYIMELDSDLYVDGRYKGNNSRYINHSCDPNCELQRWVVNGQWRIGIYAIKDIQPGEPLSYDYQFDTNEADTFRCHCGAETCRGTMAPKKKTAQIERSRLLQIAESSNGIAVVNKTDREQLIQAGKLQERRMSLKAKVEDEWSRSYTGKLIPGETVNEIKGGPIKSSLNLGRHYGCFLVRNINQGRDLLARQQMLAVRQAKEESKFAH